MSSTGQGNCRQTGAGKSTLAQNLALHLRKEGHAVCILDGDELRLGLSHDLGFSIVDREEQGRRAAEIARLLNQNGIFVIVALVSPSFAGRALARKIISSPFFIEIYVSTPLEVCQERDPKGLYASARQNPKLELTGVSAPYQAPLQAECVIDTSAISLPQAIELLASLISP